MKLIIVALFSVVSVSQCLGQWTQVDPNSKLRIFDIAADGDFVLASAMGEIFFSVDKGSSFQRMQEHPELDVAGDLQIVPKHGHSRVFAAGGNGGTAFYTDDTGRTWTEIDLGLSLSATAEFFEFESGARMYIHTFYGLIESLDSGDSWSKILDRVDSASLLLDLEMANGILFGALQSEAFTGGVTISSDMGRSWKKSLNSEGITRTVVSQHVKASNKYVYVCSRSDGVWRTTNLGVTWDTVNSGLPTRDVIDLAIAGDLLLATTAWKGIYLSRDYGATWTDANQGIVGDSLIYPITLGEEYAYCGGSRSGVWRRSLAEFYQLGVKPNEAFTSISIYPNPSSSQISIALMSSDELRDVNTASIYSSDGRPVLVLDLHSYDLQHSIQLNVHDLPPGVYRVILESSKKRFSGSFIKR